MAIIPAEIATDEICIKEFKRKWNGAYSSKKDCRLRIDKASSRVSFGLSIDGFIDFLCSFTMIIKYPE